jgi:hypothetical protein
MLRTRSKIQLVQVGKTVEKLVRLGVWHDIGTQAGDLAHVKRKLAAHSSSFKNECHG